MPARPDWPPTRVLTWLYCAPAQRRPVAALFGIEREIAQSLKPGLDHQIAHVRLGWWHEEFERCAQGRPSHPLTRELAAGFAVGSAAALAGLAGLVDTAVWDLSAATFDNQRELDAYCQRWSGALIEPLVRLALPGSAGETCRALGRSLRELELLNTLAHDARAGRLRVPLEALAQAGVAPELLAQPPWPAQLAPLLQARHRQLRVAVAAGVGALARPEQAALRALMVWAVLVARISQRAARALPAALKSSDHQAPLDGYRAWRAARQADAGRVRVPVD
jgi:phytoene synthase